MQREGRKLRSPEQVGSGPVPSRRRLWGAQHQPPFPASRPLLAPLCPGDAARDLPAPPLVLLRGPADCPLTGPRVLVTYTHGLGPARWLLSGPGKASVLSVASRVIRGTGPRAFLTSTPIPLPTSLQPLWSSLPCTRTQARHRSALCPCQPPAPTRPRLLPSRP